MMKTVDEETKKKRNKTILIILFIIFNAVVILITALNEFTGKESAAQLSDVRLHWYFLLPAAGCWLAAVTAECLKYCILMKKECGRVNIKLCVETVLLGRYYDNITPSGIGGQPFQIYYMKKGGLSNADSAAIPLTGFVSMQFGFVILALFMFIFGAGLVKSDFIRITSYFGLFMYAIVPVFILMFSFCENTTRRFLNWVIRILHKIKIVKDPYATSLNWSKDLGDYAIAVKRITKNGRLCLQVMGLSFIYQIGITAIPYFVIMAFGGNVDFISCFITTLAIYATITFIPTPGNAGVAEGSFYAVFVSLTSGYIFWAMLVWRFFVFYLFILIGLLIYLKYFIINRRNRHLEKKAAAGQRLMK